MMNENEIKTTAAMYELTKAIDEKGAHYAMLCTVRDLLRDRDSKTALAILEEINLGEIEK